MSDVLTPTNAAAYMRKWGGIDVRTVDKIVAGLKIGLYGPGGSGKTTTVATACNSALGKPMLYINARGNPHVVASRGADIEVVDIMKFKEIEDIRKDIVTALNRGDFPYKSIALDTVTEMMSMDLRDRYGAMANVEWTQHSATTADGLNLIRNFSDIADNYGINLFFVFQEVSEDREIRGQKVNRSELALNKALQSQAPGIINWLGRMYILDDAPRYTRCLDFRPIEKQQVSKWQVDPDDERFKGILMEIFDPNLGDIIDAVKGGKPYPVDAHLKPGTKR